MHKNYLQYRFSFHLTVRDLGTRLSFFLILRKVPTNSKVFLLQFMIMQEMWILTGVMKIQKENWG